MPVFFSFALLLFELAFYQVSLLLKDSFIDSFPIKDRPFIKVNYNLFFFGFQSLFIVGLLLTLLISMLLSVIYRHTAVFCTIRFSACLVRS